MLDLTRDPEQPISAKALTERLRVAVESLA
jgi:hypothetical protein